MDPQQPPGLASMSSNHDFTTKQFFRHSSGKRVSTDAAIAKALKSEYPGLELVIAPAWNVDLLGYAAAGHAKVVSIQDDKPTTATVAVPAETESGESGEEDEKEEGEEEGEGKQQQHKKQHKQQQQKQLLRKRRHKKLPSSLVWTVYQPPSRRIDGNPGGLALDVQFGKFLYTWQGTEFIVYLVDGRDGMSSYPPVRNNYILTADRPKADALVVAAGRWANELHDQVWVWDDGRWIKSAELFESVRKASWDNVILDEAMKEALIADHVSFFDSRETYRRLGVPWKRGLIFYGPPGNGKTISIKAMMHTLYDRKDPVPALYVRSFSSVCLPLIPLSFSFPLCPFTLDWSVDGLTGEPLITPSFPVSSSAAQNTESARSSARRGSSHRATSSSRTSTRS